ncbi:MFS transporter [Nonomuraea sp. NPDC002799]
MSETILADPTITTPPKRARFALVWVGSAISTVGTRTLGIAYPLLALTQTDSPTAAGWAGFALTLPILVFYVPGGLLVDRMSPRSIIVWAEFGRMLSVASVLAMLPFGGPTLPHIIGAAAAEGALWVLYTLAEAALLPSVVQPIMMERALAKSEAAGHLASIAGRPLGGYLFGAGRYIPFVLNTVLFALSCSLFAGWPRETERRPAGPSLLGNLAAGFQELKSQSFLGGSIMLTTFTNLMVNALIMIFVAGSGGMPSLDIGLVLAVGGLGGAIGSAVAYRWPRVRYVLQLHMWIWVAGLSVAAVGATLGWRSYTFAAALFITGIGGGWSNVAIRSVEVHCVKPGTLARVVGVSRLSSHGALCVAAPLGGLLVAAGDVEGATRALCAMMLVVAVVVSIWKPLRTRLTPFLPLPDMPSR